MNSKINLPDIELVAAKVHEAWIKSKLAAGVTSRKSEKGEEMMVDYELLSEEVKELDRGTVRAVFSAIKELENFKYFSKTKQYAPKTQSNN